MTDKTHDQKQAFDTEELGHWYLRLNGFLTIPNFVVHRMMTTRLLFRKMNQRPASGKGECPRFALSIRVRFNGHLSYFGTRTGYTRPLPSSP